MRMRFVDVAESENGLSAVASLPCRIPRAASLAWDTVVIDYDDTINTVGEGLDKLHSKTGNALVNTRRMDLLSYYPICMSRLN
jgi:hypothetical protein